MYRVIMITDLKNMPGFNPEVPNGHDSVSKAKVYLVQKPFGIYPYCEKHGAMNKVSVDGIWRCLVTSRDTCDNACYQFN